MILPPTPGHDHGGKQMGGAVANMLDGSGSGNGQWRDTWKKAIVEETGDHLKGKGGDHVADMHKVQVMEGKCRNAATTRRVAEAARSNLLNIVA
mmetsp:Transcript_888/g.783  ORF Transcript_888/g.783 Transcript_888/m.783 type:complete len:94 (-) Transcript_888:217-498(-)